MKKITNPSDTVLIDPNEPLILPDGTALVGRIEWFLYALCCLDYQNLPTPMSRIEEFANALITGEIPNIEPQSRAEQFFLAILDGNVSNLPQPQSRSEVLLDKLARGEFDLSDVEPIQSHYELLLAYLIKNGGIGNIDYVLYEFSEAMKTMYNTVEKPFKSLELSGNTLVNCVLEDTENDDYTSFDKDYSGTSFTINGTSEGAIKSATLSGQTLVNIVNGHISLTDTNSIYCSFSNGDYVFQAKDSYEGRISPANMMYLNIVQPLKQNTTYTLIVEQISGGNSSFGLRVGYSSDNFSDISEQQSHTGIHKVTFLTSSTKNVTTLSLRLGAYTDERSISFKNIMIIEGDHTQEDIPYFTGMQSVKLPALTTTGKNLFDMNRPYDAITDSQATVVQDTNQITVSSAESGIYVNANFILDKDFFVGKTVTGSCLYESDEKDIGTVQIVYQDGNGEHHYQWIRTPRTFTFPNSFIGDVMLSVSANNTGTPQSNTVTVKNIQLELGSTATSYEPHKSNILTVNEDVTLRGIGDVQDELNLLTGEVVERIGEIVLDGSEEWKTDINGAGVRRYFLEGVGGDLSDSISNSSSLLCDKFKASSDIWTETNDGTQIVKSNGIYFIDSSVDSLDMFVNKLKTTNIKVQYSLIEKPIKAVDLNVVDQNNIKIDKIHVFDETTHVNASSNELTPTVNIGKSVSYPTIIKPNTKYTVDLKRNDKPLTVNLGGTEVTFTSGETRKTITTPSTLTNDKLSYYGVGAKCNEIMLIEGEVEGNVDYFTGMQSVVMQNQMPVLTTTGKNLCDGVREYNGANDVYGANFIKVEEGRRYGIYQEDKNFLRIDGYSNNKEFVTSIAGGNVGLITIPSGVKYIKWKYPLYGEPYNENSKIMIALSDRELTLSDYEPYKSSILSCNEDVTLRGIGDVQDTLDCLTGEVTQRIREVILDGTEGWALNRATTNHILWQTTIANPAFNSSVRKNNMLCNKLIVEDFSGFDTKDYEFISINNGSSNIVYLKLDKTKASTLTELKNYLQSNPLTVQYQLATPNIKTVDLNVVDQDGNTIPKIKSYNGVTHLEVTVPKQSLLPNVSAEVATDNSKDMSLLTTKYQEISETQSAIQDNIQSQSDEIDTALMATTEIFESILE